MEKEQSVEQSRYAMEQKEEEMDLLQTHSSSLEILTLMLNSLVNNKKINLIHQN